MAFVQPYPRFRHILPDGTPAVGYKLYSYLAGTSTPTPLYTSQTQAAQHPNPLSLDGNGEAAIWLAPNVAYKLVLKTDADVDVWTLDGINVQEGGFFTTLNVTGAATFATISASGQITVSTAAGVAPFVITAGAAKVANLDADLLDGKQWDAPGAIGTTTHAPGKFTSLQATGAVTFGGAPNDKVAVETANTARWILGHISEEITLNTGGTTTDSVADMLPANSIIHAVVARVTEGISVATNWALGDSAVAARFLTATTDLTLGTQKVGLNHMKGAVAADNAGPTQATAAKLRITTTGTPTAGKVRVTVFYSTFVAPAS